MFGEPTGIGALLKALVPKSYDGNKCKTNIKLSIQRMKLAKNKKAAELVMQRKEIGGLLKNGKDESARIKCEHVIRGDLQIEAWELLELFCELLLARHTLIDTNKKCPVEIREAVATIIWAGPSAGVDELMVVREQLALRFGKSFAKAAVLNEEDCVNSRVVQKLTFQTPEQYLVTQYLLEIAKENDVEWSADPETSITSLGQPPAPPNLPGGGDAGSSQGGGGMPQQQQQPAPFPVAPAPVPDFMGGSGSSAGPTGGAPVVDKLGEPVDNSIYKDSTAPSVPPGPEVFSLPQEPTSFPSNNDGGGDGEAPSGDGGAGGIPDFDELTARFEALKRKG